MDPSSASGGERVSGGNWLISLSAKLLGAGEEGRERWERRLSRAPAGGRRHRRRGNLRVGAAGVTACSRRVRRRRSQLRVGDDGEAGGGITRSRLNHRSSFLFCGVDAVEQQGIAGEGRPREQRAWDCRREQTDEPKQMSHKKISMLCSF